MRKKLTTEEFITRSKEVHGESKYDYSECAYAGTKEKVWLLCREHNHKFNVSPDNHIHKRVGCTKCSGDYIPTTEEFIARSKEVHGELKYDYSDCIYKNNHDKVRLRCIEHDHKFSVPPNAHIHLGRGCTKCVRKYIPTTEEFIASSKEVHGELKYDYSECVYKNNHDKVTLRCIEHDHKFAVQPAAHIHSRRGCTKCSGHYIPTTEEFIARSKEVHGELKYDYSECVYARSHITVTLRCIEHNHKFEVTPSNHIHQGIGCTLCNPSGWSKKSSAWLAHIMQAENIYIQHGDNAVEFRIPGTRWSADGYCTTTNTIYEFHGDAWHGNPEKYPPTAKCHPFDESVTAEQLYKATIQREHAIRNLGYNLIVIWERDWDACAKPQKKRAKILTVF